MKSGERRELGAPSKDRIPFDVPQREHDARWVSLGPVSPYHGLLGAEEDPEIGQVSGNKYRRLSRDRGTERRDIIQILTRSGFVPLR